jgi:lysophospholipase L1-like esterase
VNPTRHLPEHRAQRSARSLGLLIAAGLGLVLVGGSLGVLALRGGAPAAAQTSNRSGPLAEASPADPLVASVRAGPAPSASGRRYPADAPVLLLGDSLAVGIEPLLETGWGARQLVVEAEEGRSTSTAAALLADHSPTTPPVWVVSLGTNDAPEDFPAAAASIVAMAGPDRCVVWFDVHRALTDKQVNAALEALAVSHPNVHLVSWQSLALEHPEWFSSDGIHPSSEGYAARADQAVRAVADLCTEP